MKKFTLFLLTSFLFLQFSPIKAQENYTEQPPKIDESKTTIHISDLYSKFFALEAASKEINSEMDSTYEILTTKIQSSVTDLKNNVTKIGGTIDALNNEVDSLVQAKVENINGTIQTMKTTQDEFGNTVKKSFEQLENISKTQKDIIDAQTTQMKRELEERRHRVVETAAFIKTANVSLNTLVLSNALTDYLNKVGDLNNPTNEELGFSITEKVVELVETEVFKDKKKLGNKKKDRFLGIVGNLINNPITQTLTLGMSSIVTSLTGVDQAVTNATMESDDVSIDELQIFREKLKQYVVHYQALSHSNTQFEHKLTGIKMRIEALEQLMKNFVNERVNTLYNQQSTYDDLTLTQLIQKQYDVRDIEQHVEKLNVAYTQNGELQYEEILADQRLNYPSYALTQSRFIYDELDALTKEYILGLKEYQTNLEEVLNKAKAFGEASKIDQKIDALREQLVAVEKALIDAVNMADVKSQFQALSTIEQ